MRLRWSLRPLSSLSPRFLAPVVLTLGPFLFLASLAHGEAPLPGDVSLARAVQAHLPEGLLPPFLALDALGQRWTVAIYGGATIVALWLLRYRLPSLLVIAGLFGAQSNTLAKLLIARPRPDAGLVEVHATAQGFSFPSGDVQLFTIFFGLLFFLTPRLMTRPRAAVLCRIGCGLLMALVGLGRVALGVHWPSDVLGGYLLGGFILWGLIMAYRRFSSESARKPPFVLH